MDGIKAMIQDGRVVTEAPLALPDGTPVTIVPSIAEGEAEWDDSPEGIADWLKWYDSLQPLVFTNDEREALERERSIRKQWELAHADEQADKLRELWR